MSKSISQQADDIYKQAGARLGAGLFVLFLLAACATPPQTRQLLSANRLTAAVYLDKVPFFPQRQYQCGPAALAMLLVHLGIDTDSDELVNQVYLPARKGSLQIELLASTRRYHHIPYVIAPRLEDLLHEVESGNPVLVLQNLGLSWAPVWHYAVAVGYNLPRQQIILHSGTEQAHAVSLETFERTWQRAGRWGMVVTAIDQIPASADPGDFLAAVAGLQGPDNRETRHHAYTAAARRWPEQLPVQISLGNSFYELGNPAAAEQVYRTALARHPQSASALNNLAQTLADQDKLDEALAIAQQALKLGGPFISEIQDTLDDIERKRGLQ